MDLQTVEQQYHLLQEESLGVMQALQTLAFKLKTASEDGDPAAREWLLDLKALALNIQGEQQRTVSVMQSVHQATQHDLAALQQADSAAWRPGYPQTPQAFQPQSNPQQPSGAFLNRLEQSGFGRMLMMGAGFGIGDDLIQRIF